jgi:hypothetical protein
MVDTVEEQSISLYGDQYVNSGGGIFGSEAMWDLLCHSAHMEMRNTNYEIMANKFPQIEVREDE